MDLKQAWLHTLTLVERGSTLRENTPSPSSDTAAPAAVKSTLVEQWSSQPPFSIDFTFAERLAADDLTEEMFTHLLTEPIEETGARASDLPAWVVAFTEAWSDNASTESIAWSQQVTEHNLYGFIQVVEPLILHYLCQVRSGIQTLGAQYADLPFDPQTIDNILLAPIPAHIFQMTGRTLVLELNIARLRGQLSGETPEERYRQFFEQLLQADKRSALFEDYVVLARQLTTYLSNWAEASLEFLQRLCADWSAIQATFTPDEKPGVLVKLESGLGDSHNGGRTVGIAQFASGFRLVYKPRPQGMTRHFQELLAWLNKLDGLAQPFRTMKVLDRGSYGWVEFVRAQTCQTVEEVERFYQRQGGYLALLYVLAGTDIHQENLIAAGEHPILIDVETLFHPMPMDPTTPEWARPVTRALQASVLSSLLLPTRLDADEDQAGIDISGLGSVPGQLSPKPVPTWEDTGTDKMHIIRKRVPLPETLHRPTLNDQDVDVSNYLETIISGFEIVYRLLVKYRAEILAGRLTWFAEDEVRVILRSTRTYAILLSESYHPNHLRDALTRDRLFDYLWQQVPRQSALGRVIPFEQHDLHRGNIPLFTARPTSCDLWSSAGERIPDYFSETSMADVRRRFSELNDRDMDAQVWFIRASFLSLSEQLPVSHARAPYALASQSASTLQREHLLDMAQAVGARLEAFAHHHKDYVGWIGLMPEHKTYRIAPLDLNFYGGVPGITLFLAYLGAITGEQRYTHLAEQALFTIQSQVEEHLPIIRLIGAFNGWGGVVYLFTHLAVLWNRRDLFAAADPIVERMAELVEEDNALDVIGGAAGCIPCLLALHRCSHSIRALEVATCCGDHLIARAETTPNGVGWRTIESSQPVTGFAHGVAGIAWALSMLADVTGEGRFREIVSSALAYERHAFAPEIQNWRSLRSDELTKDDTVQWCWGATGIGLARLDSTLTDPHFQTEIETALQTTLSRGFGGNHSLCHGDLGNLELLLQASQKLKSSYWQTQVDSIVSAILDDISLHGWKGGAASVTGPELMTGIAGIGYQLLRLSHPAKVPSVLTLAPPIIL